MAKPSGGDPVASSEGYDSHEQEWQECRNTIAKFDDRLADLRKYAFSFITALLTADSVLGQLAGTSGIVVSSYVKLVVFLVTLLLILGARFLDNIYRSFQRAAALRARVLEVRLNFELTEVIADKYQVDRTASVLDGIYYLFALAALGLGAGVFYPDFLYMGILAGFATASGVVILITGWRLNVRDPWPDWTIDRLECTKGESVKITLSNLGQKKKLWFENGATAWKVKRVVTSKELPGKEKVGGRVHTEVFVVEGEPPTEGELWPGESYDWLWETKNAEPGFYVIVPSKSAKVRISSRLLGRKVVFLKTPPAVVPRLLRRPTEFRRDARPLHRKIRVKDPPQEQSWNSGPGKDLGARRLLGG